ncbi:methyltransferase domain-containing protein [bacterium]|jgi:trans-aconitate methyltransferase|nr:methyltransferase domain-containing protein [Verrucomicrobiales bacterium]MDC0251648.1 methyltransferase domain-containing protein [bacterium]
MSYPKFRESAARRGLSDFPLSKKAKLHLGTFFGFVFPRKRKAIAAAPFAEDHKMLNRAIRNGLYAEAFKKGDHATLRNFLSHYWSKEAEHFRSDWNKRFQRMFLQHDVSVIDELEEMLAGTPQGRNIDHLYEVGYGGGQVLEYLHDRFPQFKRLTGIDLGEEQVEKNKKAYDLERLSVVTADACDWIPENARPGCVILTNGGVFEYFLQSELEALFSEAAKPLAPVALCLVETVATDHDLDTERGSLIHGREMAFSHNYTHILKSTGFDIVSSSERPGDPIDGGGRWIRVLAVTGNADQ